MSIHMSIRMSMHIAASMRTTLHGSLACVCRHAEEAKCTSQYDVLRQYDMVGPSGYDMVGPSGYDMVGSWGQDMVGPWGQDMV